MSVVYRLPSQTLLRAVALFRVTLVMLMLQAPGAPELVRRLPEKADNEPANFACVTHPT